MEHVKGNLVLRREGGGVGALSGDVGEGSPLDGLIRRDFLEEVFKTKVEEETTR